MDPKPTPAKAPRRDALRNDAVVIQAAREVFAEQGSKASMETIAARAGLGVGTIYRRFAGKDALIEAIGRLFIEELDQAAASALAHPDPGAGLEGFLDFVGTFHAEKRKYAAELTARVADDEVSARTEKRLRALTQKAVDSGALAPDITGADIKALIVGIGSVVALSPDDDDSRWRRFVRVHLDGLRATR